MKLFEWFAGSLARSGERERKGLSRRDFFARVTGRQRERAPTLPTYERPIDRWNEGRATDPAPPPFTPSPDALHTFQVADFPGDRGQKILPLLRVGLAFQLRRERDHPDDPHAVRIVWGRSHVGYVPPHISPEVAPLVEAGTPPFCRVCAFDAEAEPPFVLTVELTPFEPH